jgi:prepilin-type processing-associated H-X9-DG protein
MEAQRNDKTVRGGRSDVVAGLIFSLIGLPFCVLILPSILGIIFSGRALSRLQKWGAFKVLASVGLFLGLAGLLGFLFSGFHGSHSRELARRAGCMNSLKQVTMAILTYASDHGGSSPTHLKADETGRTSYRDLGILYPLYVNSLDVFTCVSADYHLPARTTDAPDNKPFSQKEAKHVSYAYGLNKNARNKAWTSSAPATTRILADRHASRALTKKSNHKTDGRNVAFADGHVKWIPGKAPLDSDPENPDPNAHGTGPDWWSER